MQKIYSENLCNYYEFYTETYGDSNAGMNKNARTLNTEGENKDVRAENHK